MGQAYGNKFAQVYNIMWADFAKNIAPFLLKFYQTKCNLENKHILDLCCGTGELAKSFLEEGYRVTGIDLSESMLQYATSKTKKYIDEGRAKFIKADAKDFTLEERVSLVISTYDALNHLPDIQALKSCFKSVYEVLIDGGFFIFDLNTKLGLNYWNSIHFIDKGNIVLLNRGIHNESEGKATTRITGFIESQNGLYERFDEIVYNTAFDLSVVKKLLNETGWHEVHFAKSTSLNIPIDKPEEEERIFIVAKK